MVLDLCFMMFVGYRDDFTQFYLILPTQQMDSQVASALATIGNKNKYQYITFFILFMLNGFVNLIMVGPTFIFMNPLFACNGDTDNLLDQSKACDIINECQIRTKSPFTIVGQLQLYCDKQFDRSLIQSIYFLGSIIGMLFLNFISDHKGRKVALVIAQSTGILGMFITLLGTQYRLVALVALGQFFCGSSGYCMLIQTFLYLFQCCQEVFRQRATVALNYAWCITFSLLGVLYYWYNHWFDYLLYVSIIPMTIVLILSILFLVQGPHYLYRHRQLNKCLESLHFIAKINGKLAEFETLSLNFKIQEQTKNSEEKSIWRNLKDMVTSPKYLKITIILCFSESGANLYYLGTNYAVDQIGLEYGLNMIISGVIQAFAFFAINIVIEKIPRKKTLLILYGLLAGLGFLFIIPAVRDDLVTTVIILGILRFIITIAFIVVIITLTEAYPPQTQSIGTGLVQAIGQLGAFLSPIVINLCISLQVYPIIVLSGVALLFIVVPMTAMVETKPTIGGSIIKSISPQNIKSSGLRFMTGTPKKQPLLLPGHEQE